MNLLNAQILAAFITSLCDINMIAFDDEHSQGALCAGRVRISANLTFDGTVCVVFATVLANDGLNTQAFRKGVRMEEENALKQIRDAVNEAKVAGEEAFIASHRKANKSLSNEVQWCRDLWVQARKNGDQDLMDFIATCGRIFKAGRFLPRDRFVELRKCAWRLVRTAA